MPGLLDEPSGGTKRKRLDVSKATVKRVRSENDDEDHQARILLLETEIFESKSHYNNIPKLIKLLNSRGSDADISAVSAIALCRVFARLMASGDLERDQATSEKDAVVVMWLKERYVEYKVGLIQLLGLEESAPTALTLLMRTLKSEGIHLKGGREYNFPTIFLKDIVRTLLSPTTGDSIRAEFNKKYVAEYDDIRYYSFRAIE